MEILDGPGGGQRRTGWARSEQADPPSGADPHRADVPGAGPRTPARTSTVLPRTGYAGADLAGADHAGAGSGGAGSGGTGFADPGLGDTGFGDTGLVDLDGPGAGGTGTDGAARGVDRAARTRLDSRWLAPFSPESLGISGLAAATTVAGAQVISLIALTTQVNVPGDLLERYGFVLMAGGALSAVLGGIGITRLRADSSSLARGVTGAAFLVGVLLAAAGGLLAWQATGMPATPNGSTA